MNTNAMSYVLFPLSLHSHPSSTWHFLISPHHYSSYNYLFVPSSCIMFSDILLYASISSLKIVLKSTQLMFLNTYIS